MGKMIISLTLISCLFLLVNIAHADSFFKPTKRLNGLVSIMCSLGRVPSFMLVCLSKKHYPVGLIPGLAIALKETGEDVIYGFADVLMPVGNQRSVYQLFGRK